MNLFRAGGFLENLLSSSCCSDRGAARSGRTAPPRRAVLAGPPCPASPVEETSPTSPRPTPCCPRSPCSSAPHFFPPEPPWPPDSPSLSPPCESLPSESKHTRSSAVVRSTSTPAESAGEAAVPPRRPELRRCRPELRRQKSAAAVAPPPSPTSPTASW